MNRSVVSFLRYFLLPCTVLICILTCDHSSFASINRYITLQDQNISIHADSTPLDEILNEIAERAGISIVYYGSLGRNINITAEIDNVPIEKAFKRILKNSNLTFLYKKDPFDNVVISRISIFSGDGSDEKRNFGSEHVSGPPSVKETQPEKLPYDTDKADIAITRKELPENKSMDTQEGISFTRNTRSEFMKINRDTIVSQIETVPVSLSIGSAGYSSEVDSTESRGLQIISVADNSLLSDLGLQSGDVINNINGSEVSNNEQLADTIHKAITGPGSGMVLRIEVERNENLEPLYINME